MPAYATRIRPFVRRELDAAALAEQRGHFFSALQHLQRAHVLGQASTALHVGIHWQMFRFALRNGATGQAFGQLWRTFAAALFTALKLVPWGNTGDTGVSGFRRMPVADDLQALMDAARA
ncbi:DUF3703 domain-containing protein [Comamonadaceae bacterium G21597-S1]|nr:DUF3703 domain-containing protein [Comamonadaceae bacterium G21597-S1]